MPPKPSLAETSDLGVFIPADAVWPALTSDEATLVGLLRGLPRDETLFMCARVNTTISGMGGSDSFARQKTAVQEFFTGDEAARINAFARPYGGADKITVFFRGQLLELMRWAAHHCPKEPADPAVFSSPDNRRRFAQAALVAGMLWSNRTYGGRLSLENGVEEGRLRALGSFRKGLEETNLAPHLGIIFGRGWVMFTQYLPLRYPRLAREFEAATGLTIDQYLTCVVGLAVYTLGDRADGPIFNARGVAAATAYKDIFPLYLARESQSPDQLAGALQRDEAVPYKAIRERPILVLDDGRAVILDPAFYGEKVSIAPLFFLLEVNKGKKANEVFGAFGLAFEDYATDLLKRMFPAGNGLLVRRLSCNVPGHDQNGREFEIDAILNDGAEAVVFEMKAAWIRDDKVLDDTPEAFVEHLRSKYGVQANPAAGNEPERPKGVAQLARIIRAIAGKDCNDPSGEYRQLQLIYPVLVVHDTRMDAPAYGDFLATEFRSLLGDLSHLKARVAPLTVMTIADLENLEMSIDQFGFRELLEAYTKDHPDRLRSLHNFMAFSPFSDKIMPSETVKNASFKLTEHALHEMFPKPSGQ